MMNRSVSVNMRSWSHYREDPAVRSDSSSWVLTLRHWRAVKTSRLGAALIVNG